MPDAASPTTALDAATAVEVEAVERLEAATSSDDTHSHRVLGFLISDSRHDGTPEQTGGPDEQNADDNDERDAQFQLGTDDIGTGEILQNTDQHAANGGAAGPLGAVCGDAAGGCGGT